MKNDNFQTCLLIGHEMNQITFICTYKKCEQAQRIMCDECLQKKIHNHVSQRYVTKLDEFFTHLKLVYPKMGQQKQDAKKISDFIQECKQIIQQLHIIVEQQQTYYQHLKIIDSIYKLSNIKVQEITNQQLNSLINIDEGNINSMYIQNNVQKIILQLQDLNKELIKFSEVQQIEVKYESIQSPNISQNEKYLGFINRFEQLTINKINHQKNVMNKNFSNKQTNIVKFSQDSNFIFVGDIKGNFKYFSLKNNFKQIFSKRMSWHCISDLLQIDNNQVIIAQSEIFIIDLIKKRQLLKIYNSQYVHCLEFDRINNLIICVYKDKKIIFYERNTGYSVIEKSFSNQQKIFQVQLINKSQNLIGCDQVSLKLFQIDLKKRKLNLIKVFYYDVQYFRYVLQEQRIIIRNINQLIITDINFNIIYETQIKGQKFHQSYRFEQLESMNYIIVKDKNGSLKILKNMND